MAEYRKFWLVNSLGNKYYLSDDSKSKAFFSSPTGFGFKSNHKTKKVNNSELLISEGLDMIDISGELVFYNSSPNAIYSDYQEFINFIKFRPLKFHYLTPNFVDDESYSFYSDVLISNIVKGEMSSDSMMRVQMTIHRLSQWLDAKEQVYEISNIVTDIGKYYPLVRPYHYSGNGFGSTLIHNNGTDEVGFIITMDGTIQNPIFSLYQNNIRYGVCALTGTYTHIVVDSVDGESHLYLERDGSSISNPEQRQDFSIRDGTAYFTWCKLKVGESIFTLTAGNIDTFDGRIELAFKNSYFSV